MLYESVNERLLSNVFKDRVCCGEDADELDVDVHVRLPASARRKRHVHAVQGHQAPDGEGADRRDHFRCQIFSLRRQTAARKNRASYAGNYSEIFWQ